MNYWKREFLQKLNPGILEDGEFDSIYKRIEGIHNCARIDGLLALEYYRDADSLPELLARGVQFVVDGTDPEVIFETLIDALLAGNPGEKELIEGVLYIQGTMSLQGGDSEQMTAFRLASLMGTPELLNKIENYSME